MNNPVRTPARGSTQMLVEDRRAYQNQDHAACHSARFPINMPSAWPAMIPR